MSPRDDFPLSKDPDWFLGLAFVDARDGLSPTMNIWFLCPSMDHLAMKMPLNLAIKEFPDLVCASTTACPKFMHEDITTFYDRDWLPITPFRLAVLKQAAENI